MLLVKNNFLHFRGYWLFPGPSFYDFEKWWWDFVGKITVV